MLEGLRRQRFFDSVNSLWAAVAWVANICLVQQPNLGGYTEPYPERRFLLEVDFSTRLGLAQF
jgi:hypothetical protein